MKGNQTSQLSSVHCWSYMNHLPHGEMLCSIDSSMLLFGKSTFTQRKHFKSSLLCNSVKCYSSDFKTCNVKIVKSESSKCIIYIYSYMVELVKWIELKLRNKNILPQMYPIQKGVPCRSVCTYLCSWSKRGLLWIG